MNRRPRHMPRCDMSCMAVEHHARTQELHATPVLRDFLSRIRIGAPLLAATTRRPHWLDNTGGSAHSWCPNPKLWQRPEACVAVRSNCCVHRFRGVVPSSVIAAGPHAAHYAHEFADVEVTSTKQGWRLTRRPPLAVSVRIAAHEAARLSWSQVARTGWMWLLTLTHSGASSVNSPTRNNEIRLPFL